jgi:hypothetical protein
MFPDVSAIGFMALINGGGPTSWRFIGETLGRWGMRRF